MKPEVCDAQLVRTGRLLMWIEQTKPKLKRSLDVSSHPTDEKPKRKRRQPENRAPIKPWTEGTK